MIDPEDVKLLIVDDEDDVRLSLATFFEDEGFDVLEVNSAEGALELFGKFSPDLALVDIRLPGMDGDSFIQKVFAENPQVGFVIYTGSSEYSFSDGIRALATNHIKVVIKPVSDLNILRDTLLDLYNEISLKDSV